MANSTISVAMPALARLDWECQHFGLLAAQLTAADLNDSALTATLHVARREGIQLLVWPGPCGRDVPQELLDEFGGALVDRKATYFKSLQPEFGNDDALQSSQGPVVVPYTLKTASPGLIDLAISAGAYSRFHIDSHIPHDKFEAMYRQWIERSVTGDMADAVLVVPWNSGGIAHDRIAGMITLSESAGVARIGLIAVAAEVRGSGIGSALMRAAHRWTYARKAREAQVVTQLANLPACRLYERSGYRLSRMQHIFHFWL